LISSKPIEPADFRAIKAHFASKLGKLEAKLDTENNENREIKDLLIKVPKPF
jgi:hypothetical protein